MATMQTTDETKAAGIFGNARNAILEGGYDDLAVAAAELTELIKEQNPPLKDNPLSPLVKPLIAVADVLAADRSYLRAAIAAYAVAAQYSLGKDDDFNKQSVIAILKKAELLPTAAERIEAYQLALRNAPAPSSVATLAKHKTREQEDPVYFKMRAPRELPRLEEAVFDGDLKIVFGDGVRRVVRQQVPTGEIQYSVVVPRGFSRGKLAQAGVQNAQKLRRISADDDLDRVVVPADKLPLQSRRDMDFLSRLLGYGIYVDANHGRPRDATGAVVAYKFPEGSNPERLWYMGIDTHGITPHEGKIVVPLEKINFFADPALVGKWKWMPAAGGNMKTSIPEDERSTAIQALKSNGIIPSENNAGAENIDYIVVARNDKGRLNNLIQQHVLQERSQHLLIFAESLPASACSIALAAYRDACGYYFGLRHRRK
ncbi:MAG: hypothetical protein HZB47_08635 [Nitrosomonadales bacterium]|nr:hypothetical protein [Nitrosomonadales bacterium]